MSGGKITENTWGWTGETKGENEEVSGRRIEKTKHDGPARGPTDLVMEKEDGVRIIWIAIHSDKQCGRCKDSN